MSVPGSSAAHRDFEDSSGSQPLLNSTNSTSCTCSSSGESSSEAKTEERCSKGRFTSPTISIGHVYVYNFNPATVQPVDTVIEITSPDETTVKTKSIGVSPAASSGPFCRICHEGDVHEDLLSPCFCAGTVGLVHLSCVEKWLGTSGSDKCEICHYPFTTVRYPKSFAEWVRSASTSSGQRTLWGDVTCFLMLTPLAAVSGFLSIDGALKQIHWRNSVEAGCLMALATFLITVYFIWCMLTFRYHLRSYLKWRQKNHHVKILVGRRLSTTDGRFLSNSTPRNIIGSVGTRATAGYRTRFSSGVRSYNVTEPTTSNETLPNQTGGPSVRNDFNRSDFVEHLTAMFETAL